MTERKLLIVDDEPEILELLREYFQDSYTVNTAENGLEGLEKISANQPDLILTDIRMPKMDGFEMVTKLRERGDNRIVVFFTSKGDLKSVTQAMKLKCFDFIQKPLMMKQLDQVVSEAFQFLDSSSVMTDDGTATSGSTQSAVSSALRLPIGEAKLRIFFHDVANAVSIASGYNHKIQAILDSGVIDEEKKKKLQHYNARTMTAIDRIISFQKSLRH